MIPLDDQRLCFCLRSAGMRRTGCENQQFCKIIPQPLDSIPSTIETDHSTINWVSFTLAVGVILQICVERWGSFFTNEMF